MSDNLGPAPGATNVTQDPDSGTHSPTPGGSQVAWVSDDGGAHNIHADVDHSAGFTDDAAQSGTYNGANWYAGSADGEQRFEVQTGATGEHRLVFGQDGVLKVDDSPVGGSAVAYGEGVFWAADSGVLLPGDGAAPLLTTDYAIANDAGYVTYDDSTGVATVHATGLYEVGTYLDVADPFATDGEATVEMNLGGTFVGRVPSATAVQGATSLDARGFVLLFANATVSPHALGGAITSTYLDFDVRRVG